MAIPQLGGGSTPLQTDRRPLTATGVNTSQADGFQPAVTEPVSSPDVQVTLSAEARDLSVSATQQVVPVDEAETTTAEAALGRADEPDVPTGQPSASDTLGTNIDIQA